MRRLLGIMVVGAALTATAGSARAQLYGEMVGQSGIAPYYQAPGFFSTTWGVPSYGVPRTYSSFASPYGAGYGYGYYPMTYLPGYYGARLWRPGFGVPGYFYGAGYYGTISTPYRPLTNNMAVPFGYYAPGFGPPAFVAW